MKKVFLFIPVFLCLHSVFALDYQVVLPGQPRFFNLTSSSGSPTNSWFNSLVWSPIKVASFDSSHVIPGGMDYFSFQTWRDTSTLPARRDCVYEDGPSWLGGKVTVLSNGTNYFYNAVGDSFCIRSVSPMHSSWNFSQSIDGSSVRAQVDSIIWMQRAGIWDSIKIISLHAVDSIGGHAPSNPLDQVTIFLSKSNGFFSVPAFRELPDAVFMLDLRTAIPMPKLIEIYDFDPGDEFEYDGSCTDFFGGGSPPGYTYFKILSKSYTAGMDSVKYYRQRISLTLSFNSFPAPHFDTIYFSGNDWVSYPISNLPLFPAWPEENMYVTNPVNSILNYTMNQDNFIYNNRALYKTITGYTGYSSTDSCYAVSHFEPVFYTTQYAAGLGIVYYESDLRNVASSDCKTSLIWYNKGGQTWGTFISLTTGIVDELSSSTVTLSSNPVRDVCNVTFSRPFSGEIMLSDISGRLLLKEQLDGSSSDVEMNNYPSGVYVLSILGKDGLLTKKIVKE